MLRPYDEEARHIASSKGFVGDCESEARLPDGQGSETIKSGTDEQKSDTEAI